MKFGVDLDGTVFEMGGLEFYDPKNIGVPYTGCREVLQALVDAEHEVIIYSCRTNPEYEGNMPHSMLVLVQYVLGHLAHHKIPYSSVSAYKPVCDFYLDDRNLVYSTLLDFGANLRRMGLI